MAIGPIPKQENGSANKNGSRSKEPNRDAEVKLAKLLHQINHNELVEPSKITLGEWLDKWVELSIRPPVKRLRTYESYKSIIDRHLIPKLGMILLQELDVVHLEKYYADNSSTLSQTTLEHHHAVISGALKAAQKKRFIKENVAKLVENRPKREEGSQNPIDQCWNEQETKQFLVTAKSFGPQASAFYALALDSGMRKGELCGLKWVNVDLKGRKVRVIEQLLKPGPDPIYGPTKGGRHRTIHISVGTSALLAAHRKNQAEIKMKNRQHYHDQGLVFAKEWKERTRKWHQLGHPLGMNNIRQREFAKIIRAAEVRTIKFHGLRHTCATLLLKAGVPVPVVSERLGHKGVEITMNIYQHVLPDMQEDAAVKLGSILFQ